MMNDPVTEDEVRAYAGKVLGFEGVDQRIAKAGVGQITTFNSLGFSGEGSLLKPDGWYLPYDRGRVALVLETKARDSLPIDSPKLTEQIERYCDVVRRHYDLVIGIVFDGESTRAYFNKVQMDVPDELQAKDYYVDKIMDRPIDKVRIYELTMRINNSLHVDFGIKNLYHRMIFTACALVARRYDAILVQGMDYSDFHQGILNALNKAIRADRQQNDKLELLSSVYSEIKMNVSTDEENPKDVAHLKKIVGQFIDWVTEISGLLNSSAWDGEDVMAIFFNEFNRYKKKTESGQVFTPDHVTGFMYRLLDVNKDDRVLDACVGSGAFLVKAMSNMISEAGGVKTHKAREIKRHQLFGMEFDREIFALACANMLIHKDGKTNLVHMDARTESAKEWIANIGVTKVMMNPPFEKKYGCMKIVENVLNSVGKNVLCGFILPEKKLEKSSKAQMARIFRKHRLLRVVKMPENLFFGVGVTTSIFVFLAGVPQSNKKFYAVNIVEDGLVTVKNKGRHDVYGKWPEIENYWIDAIERCDDSVYSTGQWHSVDECLSWQLPVAPFELSEGELSRVVMDYELFQRNVDNRQLRESLGELVIYHSCVSKTYDAVHFEVRRDRESKIDVSSWGEFRIGDLFGISRPVARSAMNYVDGDVPFVASGNYNNGVITYVEPKFNEVADEGNCITVSPLDGSAFYQPSDFLGRGGAGSAILMLRNSHLNVNVGLFVVAVVRNSLTHFNYADQLNQDSIAEQVIMLPTALDGRPDWDRMEEMVKCVRERQVERIDVFDHLGIFSQFASV